MPIVGCCVQDRFSYKQLALADEVWALQWSASSEWVRYSRGCDGAIRFWDIRRAGCFQVLDHNRSQIEKRLSVTKSAPQRQELATASVGNSSSMGRQQQGVKRAKFSSSSSALKNAKIKEFAFQRQHLGMTSASDQSTAHYCSVTSLQTSDDGLHLFSAGIDSTVRLWDRESGCDTLVNHEATKIRVHQGSQLAIYGLLTPELYTGSSDRQILVWSPSKNVPVEEQEEERLKDGVAIVKANEDAWNAGRQSPALLSYCCG